MPTRALGSILLALLGLLGLVGWQNTAYDRDGRAIFLSPDLLRTQAYLALAHDTVQQAEEIAQALSDMPRPGPERLAERSRQVSNHLRRLRDLTSRLTERPAPAGLEPLEEQLFALLRQEARWGTAVADALLRPSSEEVQRRLAEDQRQTAASLATLKEVLQ